MKIQEFNQKKDISGCGNNKNSRSSSINNLANTKKCKNRNIKAYVSQKLTKSSLWE